jgi:hypothetical protein
MDSVARPDGPDLWTIVTTGGMALGAIEKRPDGFFIVPVASSPLGDLDPLPYISLERALEGVGAHLQGNCALDEARPGRAPPTL